MAEVKDFKTVKVEKDQGIAWVILNRPEKRNAMNPAAALRHARGAYRTGSR